MTRLMSVKNGQTPSKLLSAAAAYAAAERRLCLTNASVDRVRLFLPAAFLVEVARCKLCCKTATRSTTFPGTRGVTGACDGSRFCAFCSINSISAV